MPASGDDLSGPVRAALTLIRGYKILISPHFAGSCRFLPSCADYATVAIARHGVIRGNKWNDASFSRFFWPFWSCTSGRRSSSNRCRRRRPERHHPPRRSRQPPRQRAALRPRRAPCPSPRPRRRLVARLRPRRSSGTPANATSESKRATSLPCSRTAAHGSRAGGSSTISIASVSRRSSSKVRFPRSRCPSRFARPMRPPPRSSTTRCTP